MLVIMDCRGPRVFKLIALTHRRPESLNVGVVYLPTCQVVSVLYRLHAGFFVCNFASQLACLPALFPPSCLNFASLPAWLPASALAFLPAACLPLCFLAFTMCCLLTCVTVRCLLAPFPSWLVYSCRLPSFMPWCRWLPFGAGALLH